MRPIDADELLIHIKDYGEGQNQLLLIDPYYVRNAPTVGQPKGEWIDSDPDLWQCSCCNRRVPRLYDYCPFCGAEMEVDNVRTDDNSPDL